MSKPKNFRELLALKRGFIGTILQFPSPEIVEIIQQSGYDYVIIDNEHSYATYEQTVQMLRAAEASGIAVMIRLPDGSEDGIKKALDMGFSAIRIPNISTVDEAELIVKYAKFPPDGERGACPFVRANGFGGEDTGEFYKKANEKLVIAVNIEGVEGVNNMENIISTAGINIINVGRVDLSVALGVAGQSYHPKVEKAIRDVSDLCVKYNKCSGTFIERPEQIADYADCAGITHFLTKTPESVLIEAYRSFYDKAMEYC